MFICSLVYTVRNIYLSKAKMSKQAAEANLSQKEQIFLKLKQILDSTNDECLEQLSAKSICSKLSETFGDKVSEYKNEIKNLVFERLVPQQIIEKMASEVDNDELAKDKVGDEKKDDNNNENYDDDDDDDDENDEEDDNDDLPEVAAFADDWKSDYQTVVWTRISPKYPWWPGKIYNPSAVTLPIIQNQAIKALGKKHVIYSYASNNWYFATLKQTKPFLEHLDEFSNQKVAKTYTKLFPEAVKLAKKDYELPKTEYINNTSLSTNKQQSKKRKVISMGKPEKKGITTEKQVVEKQKTVIDYEETKIELVVLEDKQKEPPEDVKNDDDDDDDGDEDDEEDNDDDEDFVVEEEGDEEDEEYVEEETKVYIHFVHCLY